ncbi:MAG TPA: lipocalin family protein [Polyangia bacterium]|nr:lipocalin family protein [Polyangia bacterium]
MTPSPPAALLQRWLHSHEEDQGAEQVFRPSSFAFPPSRGRRGFELQAGGRYLDLGIAAADGTNARPGAWTLVNQTLTLTPDGAAAERYNVVSLAPDKLVLERAR